MKRIWWTSASSVLLFALISCTDEPINQTYSVSECGGFPRESYRSVDDSWDEYCASERITWTFDSQSNELSITNTRIWLNCCGERSMVVSESAPGEYSALETDSDAERCACDCFIDFQVTASPIAGQSIDLTIEREIPDNQPSSGILWVGSIDLTQLSDIIEIPDEDILGPYGSTVREECETSYHQN